jgi:hypothetical protein
VIGRIDHEERGGDTLPLCDRALIATDLRALDLKALRMIAPRFTATDRGNPNIDPTSSNVPTWIP